MPSSLERRFLQLTLFLIPFNLAKHWVTPESYVNGRLIDYLAPKLYLADIFLIFLLTIHLYQAIKSRPKSSYKSILESRHNLQSQAISIKVLIFLKTLVLNAIGILKKHIFHPLFLLLAYLAVTSLLTPLSTGSIWIYAKLLLLISFVYLLSTQYTFKQLLNLSYPPLIASGLTQTLIGLYQFINQTNLFEYNILGETQFSSSQFIARGSLGGALKILPYGTTPHPNVFAGFLGFCLLIIFIKHTLNHQKMRKSILASTIILLFSGAIIISQSITVIASLIIIFVLNQIISSKHIQMLKPQHIVSTLIILVFSILLYYQPYSLSDSQSYLRRHKLITSATQLIEHNLLTGVGLNQFIPAAAHATPGSMPTGFLQPVHHIYLLWLIETGLIGLLLTLATLFSLKHRFNRTSQIVWLPLIYLLLIGLNDHYPLTHHTGQFILALAFALTLTKQK